MMDTPEIGYFGRPIRRGEARAARRRFLEPARQIRIAHWRRGDLSDLSADSFLRFVVELPGMGIVGLFRSSEILEEAPDLPPAVRSELRSIFRWFNANLPAPRRLPRTAICWFRADATDSIQTLRRLIEFYRMMGHPIWMLATHNPGRIVYRDRMQVAAIPYPDRRTTSSAL